MDPKFAASLFLALFALQGLQSYHAANILFFWGMSGYSHRITIWPLVEELASRGHNVTFFSPFPPKNPKINPNITEITPEGLFQKIGMDFDPVEVRLNGGISAIQALWPTYVTAGVKLCDVLSKDKGLMEWASTAKFDLVFINGLFNDCGFGFAWKMKAQTIGYATSSVFPWYGDLYGIPEENYPEFQFHLPVNMTFTQQVWNTFTPLYWYFYRSYYYLPIVDSMIRPALNIPDMPSLEEMDQRSSLILMNTHFSEEYPRALPPWIVPVGGMHCTDKIKPLPEKLDKFIDSWKDGFIYFSFGTYVKLPLLPQHHQDAIFGALRKFPNTGFIMKWNGGEPPKNLPANVLTQEWLAQNDILGHPKIRAFISHGGLLGTQEAVHRGVPMIVFPVFAEQDYNAGRIHAAERGIMMEISELTQDKLENAIREVLTNKKYKENMVKTSKLFRDRPQSPVETAAWWVEYVLRHKETPFLKSIGIKRTWYERRMLHIWGFVAAVAGTALLLTLAILRLVMKIVFGGKKPKVSNKKKAQ